MYMATRIIAYFTDVYFDTHAYLIYAQIASFEMMIY